MGFEGDVPDWLTPVEGRQYGACSVFDIELPERIRTERDGSTYRWHFLDCVGEAHPLNDLDGLYHVAPVCGSHFRAMILRAGRQTHQNRTPLPAHYKLDGTTVHLTYPAGSTYRPGGPRAEWVDTEILEGQVVSVKWAVADGFEERRPDDQDYKGFSTRISKDGSQLEWAVNDHAGTATLQPEDAEAAEEYEKRCMQTLADHGGPGEPGQPGEPGAPGEPGQPGS